MHQDFTILPPTLILAPLVCFSKKRLFEELSESAGFLLKLPPAAINQALYAREASGSTFVTDGIALPHALTDGAMPSLLIVCMLDEKVEFQALDSDLAAVDIAFAFFFSPHSNLDFCEDILETLSEILQSTDLTASLRRSHHDEGKIALLLHKIDHLLVKKLRPELLTPEDESADHNATTPETGSNVHSPLTEDTALAEAAALP